MNKSYENYRNEVERLINQLKRADTWNFIQFYECLVKTGAWDALKIRGEFGGIGWVSIFEDVYKAAVEAEENF